MLHIYDTGKKQSTSVYPILKVLLFMKNNEKKDEMGFTRSLD